MMAFMNRTVPNMQEVAARGGRIILISDQAGYQRQAGLKPDATIEMPKQNPDFAAIVYSIPVSVACLSCGLCSTRKRC